MLIVFLSVVAIDSANRFTINIEGIFHDGTFSAVNSISSGSLYPPSSSHSVTILCVYGNSTILGNAVSVFHNAYFSYGT